MVFHPRPLALAWALPLLLATVPLAAADAGVEQPAAHDEIEDLIPGDLAWVRHGVDDAAAMIGLDAPRFPEPVERVFEGEEEPEAGPAPPEGDGDEGFADRLRTAFGDQVAAASIAGVVLSTLGLVGFGLVTRYISPKEALKNPQRSMLYGYVMGNPGVHLKKLSEEFGMKTSSILWHMRKLEGAELVRSENANGYRVFYTVEGGVEIKHVSRAVTAIHNPNARHIYEAIDGSPGLSTRQLANKLNLNPGNVRWHLRKLREGGLIEELMRQNDRLLYPTPLGAKALRAAQGTSVEAPTTTPSALRAATTTPTPTTD
ncbi:MAG: winged helix-turn-helix transcriptional regulator [Thermoplasmatota archaeon]